MIELIQPEWPAPKKVKAYSTTRQGGFSQGPYQSFNLATHVDDTLDTVQKNRALLKDTLKLPAEPIWLTQVHGAHVINARYPGDSIADACFSYESNQVCVVMTADCLPLLVTDIKARCVAAIHAGWKGLLHGVIQSTLNQIDLPSEDLLIWLGPAIGPKAFEVGEEVKQAFLSQSSNFAEAFTASKNTNKWNANIYTLAKLILHRVGVPNHAIFGGDFCTYHDADNFFSYRRDHVTGRMATLIWL